MKIAADEVLRAYAAQSLQQMARQRGIDPKGKAKDALVNLLAPGLFDPKRIAAALADTAPAERGLLDRVILLGGDAPSRVMQRELEREGLIAKPERPATWTSWSSTADRGSPDKRGSQKFADVVARLGAMGLLFSSGPYSGTMVELGAPGRRLYVPDGVLQHLPPPKLPVKTIEPPAAVQAADPSTLLRDVYTLLSFARRQPVPLTARGLIMKRALVQINGEFLQPEDAAAARSEDDLPRFALLRSLTCHLKLLVERVGELTLGERAPAYLSEPPGPRLRQLYETYRTIPDWCEIFFIPGLTVKTARGAGRSAPPAAIAARQRVLAEVAALPAERWVPLDHLIERLRLRTYEFLFSRRPEDAYQYSNSSYYGDYGYGVDPYAGQNPMGWTFPGIQEEQGWERVEAGFVRLIVTGPLRWLGVVDLGGAVLGNGSGAGAPNAVRLTATGAQLLRGETPALVAAAPHVVVQPNFQIFAFKPTGEDVLFKLDQMAERVRAEQVVEYRLTRESVYGAQRAGIDADEIAAFLERISGAPLPQNVRRTLEEWGAQHERIVIRRGVALVQAADAAALDRLGDSPDARRLLGRRLAPGAALVPLAGVTSLHDRLIEQGRLPALSEGPNELPRPHFSVDETGQITFRHRAPSLFVLGALRGFAEEAGPGVFRLSPGSLQRAAKAGLDADRVLATLEQWNAGPLPAAVPALVRRWTKDWGRAALVEAVLLQVEDAERLRELMADPELDGALRPVPGAPALAIIPRDAVEQVRAALEMRGVELADRLLRYRQSDNVLESSAPSTRSADG